MKKILVVDNDPGMCRLLAMAFRQAGIETIFTASVTEAADFLHSGVCAGMLMDFHLGAGESGAQVVAAWSAKQELPPFWMVTGTPDDADLACLHHLPSFQGIVAKPFSILDLVAKVGARVFPTPEQEMESA